MREDWFVLSSCTLKWSASMLLFAFQLRVLVWFDTQYEEALGDETVNADVPVVKLTMVSARVERSVVSMVRCVMVLFWMLAMVDAVARVRWSVGCW